MIFQLQFKRTSLSLCMRGNFACFFFFRMLIFKKSFRNTIRVSNSLDPDQAGHFIGPDVGPNCLQRLSVDDEVATSKERVN